MGPGLVAFSDDDFVETSSPSGLSDDDFVETSQSADEAPKTGPGLGEAVARGGLQGLTAGFGEEIGAAAAVALDPYNWRHPIDNYKALRDRGRADNTEAKEAHPVGYMGGQVLGGVATAAIPVGAGTGIAAKLGTGIVGAGVKGAAMGAATGLGESEKGSALEQAADTIKGAAAGAAGGAVFHGVGKALKGAAGRVLNRSLDTVAEGATPTLRQGITGVAGKERDIALAALSDNPDIVKAGGNVLKRASAVDTAVEKALTKTAPVYEAADSVAAIPTERVTDGMRKVVEKYSQTSADEPMANAAKSMIEQFERTQANGPWQTGHTTFSGLRKEVTARQAIGYQGSDLDPTRAAQLSRDMAVAMRDVLHGEIEAVAKANPALKLDVAALKADNAKISKLLDIQEAVKKAATVAEAPGGKKTGFVRDIVTNVAVGAASLPALGAKVALDGSGARALGKVANVGDKAMASLYRAARDGNTPAQLIELGLKMGLARPAAEAAAATAGALNSKLRANERP